MALYHCGTFGERMDPQFDVREVPTANLSADLVEADAAPDGDLAHHSVVLTHVQVKLLEWRESALRYTFIICKNVQAILPGTAGITLRTRHVHIGRGHSRHHGIRAGDKHHNCVNNHTSQSH